MTCRATPDSGVSRSAAGGLEEVTSRNSEGLWVVAPSVSETIKIDVWSDIACPWCYIGKQRLAQVLAEIDPDGSNFQVRYHAFQLEPFAGPADGRKEVDVLAMKFGSQERAADALAQMTERAAAEGLVFDFDRVIPTNTLAAHRLIAYARMVGDLSTQSEVVDRLFEAHFTNGLDVGDPEVLAEIGVAAGLNRAGVLAGIEDENTLAVVDLDKKDAGEIGISAVPFYIFDKKYAVGGAQTTEFFRQALTKISQGTSPVE